MTNYLSVSIILLFRGSTNKHIVTLLLFANLNSLYFNFYIYNCFIFFILPYLKKNRQMGAQIGLIQLIKDTIYK